MIVAGNTRLPYVNEEDKEVYIKDYSEAVKKGKRVKRFNNENTGEIFYELSFKIITGVVNKPL